MTLVLDHLVVAARSLDEGDEWIRSRLGARPVAGGKHPAMGTHNRLLRLGERLYLEVIAIDPEAPAPGRPRWFSLDAPDMQARLRRGPALIHWVARTDDLDEVVSRSPHRVEILPPMIRGAYRWRIGVPPGGSLAQGGAFPTFIQWEGSAHPGDALPESGCALERLELPAEATELAATLASLGLAGDTVRLGEAGFQARVRSPAGSRILS